MDEVTPRDNDRMRESDIGPVAAPEDVGALSRHPLAQSLPDVTLTDQGDELARPYRRMLAMDANQSVSGSAATDPLLPPHADLPIPGERIEQYEIIRELGRGGMGAVYLARDTKLARRVAIKFLLSDDPRVTERFVMEARATARCIHENIVIVHDVSEYRGNPLMVLEYLKGQSLRRLLSGKKLAPSHAVELMVPVVRALQCAHRHDIVHRDLKPENVFVTDTGTVKVLDFGIAKLQQRRVEASQRAEASASDAAGAPDSLVPEKFEATTTGALIGTLPYMSPEQINGGRVDHRTDLWAVGIMLCEMVTGQHPMAPLTRAKCTAIGELDQPMPSMSTLAPSLGKLGPIIDRCLIKQPHDRTVSARELLAELEPLLPASRGVVLSPSHGPFTGLAAFQESDADRFFGRAEDSASLVAQLRSQPLVTLVGPSGAGKSSLVRAGVIPMLKRSGEGWEAYVIRPGRRPIAALATLLAQLFRQASSAEAADDQSVRSSSREALAQRLRSEPGYLGTELRARATTRLRRILMFVDHFEELYTLGAEPDERAAFVACLEGVADDVASPLRVILSLRSDFLDRVAEERQFMTEVTGGLIFLPPVGRDGLRDALLRPLEAAGYRFETPALVEHMLDDLEATSAALPLLQFTATKLWQQRDRKRQLLTGDSYESIGGVAGTLAVHADAVLAGMTPRRLVLARAILQRLVTPERTRGLASLSELRALPGEPDELEQVVHYLADARLVATLEAGDTSDGSAVELIHESLIDGWPTLSRWLEDNQEDATSLTRLRAAAKQWDEAGRHDGLLWRGEAAREARRWRTRYQDALSGREQQFLDAVFAHDHRAVRTRRMAMVGVIGLLAVLVVVAAMALLWVKRAQREASQQATIASEQRARFHAELDARDRANAELREQLAAVRAALRDAELARRRAQQALRDAELARQRDQQAPPGARVLQP